MDVFKTKTLCREEETLRQDVGLVPLVSICVGVYNRGKYIEQTLQSILNQTYQNCEYIISDNASTDDSVEIIKNILEKSNRKITLYVQMTNIGPFQNFKFLFSKARGEYICIFHSDDIYHPEIVEKSIFLHKKYQNIGIVFSWLSYITKNDQVVDVKKKFKERIVVGDYDFFLKHTMLNRNNSFSCPTAVWSRDALAVICRDFQEHYPEADDLYETFFILKRGKKVIINNEPLVKYRLHEEQDSVIQNKIHYLDQSGVYKVCRDFVIRENSIIYHMLLFFLWCRENIRIIKRYFTYLWIKLFKKF
jgi:glycosyltransferase involved in cell wall biosynthesis